MKNKTLIFYLYVGTISPNGRSKICSENQDSRNKSEEPFWRYPDIIPFPFAVYNICYTCSNFTRLHSFIPRHMPAVFKSFNKPCAIVTGDRRLSKHKFGKFIDSHFLVLRPNLHPLHNKTAYGSKTTHILINTGFWNSHDRLFRKLYMIKNMSEVVIFNHFGQSWSQNKGQRNILNMTLRFYRTRKDHLNRSFILDPVFIKFTHLTFTNIMKKKVKNSPTTGFIGILVLAKLCKEVHAFGFTDPAPIFFHDAKSEHNLLRKWESDKIAKIKLVMYPH